MSGFTIRDLENLSGIKAHTIRMWEQRYNFLKPQRSCTNIRFYSNEELKTLLNIALLNKHGVKISHIDKMHPDEICVKILELREEEAMNERIINELVRDMLELETDKFELIVNKYISEHGIEEAIMLIIFPFLEKIGILWQTGHIIPAQEHFVSNVIRQKLIVAIDALGCCGGKRSSLLFLPEGEYHELGLLFLYYLLKARGYKVIYLGSNVPIADVKSIVASMKPQLAFIHLSSVSQNFNFERLVRQLETKVGDIQTIISGFPTVSYCKDTPDCVSLKRSFSEMMEFLEADSKELA